MRFHHIAQAIAYAKKTGDTEALREYTKQRTNEAAKRLMPVLARPMSGDGIYFLIAYVQAFMDVTTASMSQPERDLIDSIKSGIEITVVKASIPIGPFGNGEDEEP